MNERIQQLAEQCTVSCIDGRGVELNEIDVEKFAELIVKECIKELENDTRCRIAGADKIVAKHFGVEE